MYGLQQALAPPWSFSLPVCTQSEVGTSEHLRAGSVAPASPATSPLCSQLRPVGPAQPPSFARAGPPAGARVYLVVGLISRY